MAHVYIIVECSIWADVEVQLLKNEPIAFISTSEIKKGMNECCFRQRDDWTYSPHNAYAVSKLAMVLYSYALSRRWAAKGLTVKIVLEIFIFLTCFRLFKHGFKTS